MRLALVTRIRRLDEDGWWVLRDVRLRALLDAPKAFASSHRREAAFTRDEWIARLRSGVWLVAEPANGTGAPPEGVVGALERGDEWFVIAMWVASERRGGGLAAELIESVVEAARKRGMSMVALQVNEHNVRARRLYERLGFVATGEYETLPRAEPYTRERMVLPFAEGPP